MSRALLNPMWTVTCRPFKSCPSNLAQVINALLGDRYLEEGILPTTNEISVLKFAEGGAAAELEQISDGFFVRRYTLSNTSSHMLCPTFWLQ